MLTKQARHVLKGLKKLTQNSGRLFVRPMSSCVFILPGENKAFDFSAYADEIGSIMDQLESEGMIVRRRDGYSLTQNAIHSGQRRLGRFCAYLVNNLIAIISLIVAIIALIVSLVR